MKLLHRTHSLLAPLIYSGKLAIVPPSVNSNWPERQFLRSILLSKRIDAVLDVGANIGQYGLELRLLGFTGLIFSFEPAVDCFEKLNARAKHDPFWHTFNYAFGAEKGELLLNRMGASVFNSFREPSIEEATDFESINIVSGQESVPVETVTNILPRLMEQYGFSRPLLKMDTQGFDLEVFRGASSVVDKIVLLQSEVALKRIYAESPSWGDSMSEYEAAGFEVIGIYAVNPNLRRLIECNCFFENSSFI